MALFPPPGQGVGKETEEGVLVGGAGGEMGQTAHYGLELVIRPADHALAGNPPKPFHENCVVGVMRETNACAPFRHWGRTDALPGVTV